MVYIKVQTTVSDSFSSPSFLLLYVQCTNNATSFFCG